MTDRFDTLADRMLHVGADLRVYLEPEPDWFVAVSAPAKTDLQAKESLECIVPILAMALRRAAETP